VVSKDGQLERRSMIYTEYFARGTEPAAICDIHPTHGLMTKIAGLFGAGEDKPQPVRVEDTVMPAPVATAATTGISPETEVAPEPPKKKRGFWSRIFGGGKGDDKRNNEKANKKPGG
jgi:hypothetical protein